jgi:hypothetical protein
MTDVDRTALIELLNRLGSDDDTTVLEAARGLHRIAAESGLSWDDLLRLDRVEDEPEVDGSPAVGMASPDDAETARLIERLLRKGISDDLREDLTDMKRQLAEGSLEADDRRYLRSLAQRLGA